MKETEGMYRKNDRGSELFLGLDRISMCLFQTIIRS